MASDARPWCRLSRLCVAVLPSPGQTLLLCACLAPPDRVGEAWRQWLRAVGDPLRIISRDPWHMRSLLPMLSYALAGGGAEVGSKLRTPLRAAMLREELRHNTITRVAGEALGALSADSLDVLLAGSLAIAATAYPGPRLRHCGQLVLVTRPGNVDRAFELLRERGWKSEGGVDAPAGRSMQLVHASELGMWLGDHLIDTPHHAPPDDALWQSSRTAAVGQAGARIPAPADCLLHVLGRALRMGVWRNIDWVIDVVMLARRFNQADWRRLCGLAGANHLAGPAAVVLRYVQSELDCPVPPAVIDELAELADGDARTRPVVEDGLRQAIQAAPRRAMVHAPAGQLPWRVVRWWMDGRWRHLRPWLAGKWWIGPPVRLVKRNVARWLG